MLPLLNGPYSIVKKSWLILELLVKYNIKINNYLYILVRSRQLLECFSQSTLLLVGLHVCQVKDQSLPYTNCYHQLLLQTHLPSFTIFDALTDGYPKVCKFHLAMSAQLIQATE